MYPEVAKDIYRIRSRPVQKIVATLILHLQIDVPCTDFCRANVAIPGPIFIWTLMRQSWDRIFLKASEW